MNAYTNLVRAEAPIVDEDFDWGDKTPMATAEEEAIYQSWIDLDLRRRLIGRTSND